MNATKYQIFLKTVECGSFTKAAADLNFSQSGISHAINSLEEELGVTLLSRNRGGVTLTGDGRALLPQIQQLCTEYHRLAQQAADLRGMDAGLVKVASFSIVSAQWLPMILKAFSKQYPAIEFEIQTCDFYDQIEELIITGQADCGFLRMPSLKGLQVYPLHLDQLKVIVPCGHPLSHCDPFPVEALATEPVIQLEEGDDYEIRAAFDEMGVRPHVRYIAREDRTILSMVSNGLGISLLPELMVRHSPYPLVICQPPMSFYRRIAIGVKDEKAVSNSTQRFVDHVRAWVQVNGFK